MWSDIEMKFFIYLFYLAYLLTTVFARFRRQTTPMPKALRLNVYDRQALEIADMIEFVNSLYNDEDNSIARSKHGPAKNSKSRRIETLLKEIYHVARVTVPIDDDTETQLKKLAETVRYHVIDNPEVLEEFSNKQKNKDDGFELTTDEPVYRPSFPDEDDNEKLVTEIMEQTITAIENGDLRADARDYSEPPKTINTEEAAQVSKLSDKNKTAQLNDENAQTKPEKAQSPSSKMEAEDPLSAEKENSTNKYDSTKLENDIDDKLSTGSRHLKVYDSKTDGVKENENGYTESSDKAKNPVERFSGHNNKSIESLVPNSENENLLSHSQKESQEVRSKQFKTRHGKRDKYDKKKKYNDEREWRHKESEWINIDDQTDHRENVKENNGRYKDGKWTNKYSDGNDIKNKRYHLKEDFDRMEYEWNKRHQQQDKNDNWNVNYNKWYQNDNDWRVRDNDSDERDDWDERHDEWEKKRDSREYQGESDIRMERDNEWFKRDSRQEDGWNRNHWDRNGNEWEYKYTDTSIGDDRAVNHERFKIVVRD